jgi:AAHS family 4-hydroxybenzoate transporter-like MFS transporter
VTYPIDEPRRAVTSTAAGQWTGLQVRTLILCFMLNMLDGADVLVVSFVAPVLTAEWQVTDAVFGLVFSAGLAGMTLGALFLAPYADVFGRRTLIIASTLIIGSGMLASAFAETLLQLAALRFWTGLGIGAMLASVTSLASEFAPDRYKSFAVTTATAGYPAGATLAGLAGGQIIPAFGWEGMFLVMGAASLILLPVLLGGLPESVEFLLARQPRNALLRANKLLRAQRQLEHLQLPPVTIGVRSAPAMSQLVSLQFRRQTLLLWGAFFASFFTLYFLTSWIPRIAIAAGYPLATAINGSATFNAGAFLGLLALGWFAARIDLARLIGLFFGLAAFAMLGFGIWHAPEPVFYAGLLLIGFLVQGGFGGLYAIAARIYPAAMKTTGVGWGIGIGRLGAVAGPAVGGIVIAANFTLLSSFAIFAAPMLLAGLLVLALNSGRGAPSQTND